MAHCTIYPVFIRWSFLRQVGKSLRECRSQYWIEFHTQTARLAVATDENIEDARKLAELSAGYVKFLKEIDYDFEK